MFPVNGKVITEIEAINILTGVNSELVAAGGVCGAEGSIWLAISGNEEEISNTESIINSLSNEPLFEL